MNNNGKDQPQSIVKFDTIEDVHARINDLNASNKIGMCLLDVLENLCRATETVSGDKVDLKQVKKMLSENEQVLDLFLMINIILKGFLLLIDGDEWDNIVNNSKNHKYPKPALDFLNKVHNFEFDKPIPTSPIKEI